MSLVEKLLIGVAVVMLVYEWLSHWLRKNHDNEE